MDVLRNTVNGIMLDLMCGTNKHGPEYTGMDKRPLPGVDIMHDCELFPWPLENESCLMIMASHAVEHINPSISIEFFDECWRVLREGAGMVVITPYGGSPRWLMDPTHRCSFTEMSFQYFDPRYPLYGVYTPKPWVIEEMVYSPMGDINVRLKKMKDQKEMMR